MKTVLAILVAIVGWVSFRSDKSWVFYVTAEQSFSGNLRALFHYIYQQHKDLRLTVINKSNTDLNEYKKIYPNATFIESTKDILFARLRCKFVVITHGIKVIRGPYRYLRGIKVINLWHGIPIKGMANLDASSLQKSSKTKYTNSTFIDLFVSSSSTERALLAGCHLMSAQKIKITGMPRMDFLLCQDADLPRDYLQLMNTIRVLKNERKLVLYAPTFRDYDQKAFGFTEASITRLLNICSSNSAILAIRPHPKDNILFDDFFEQFPSLLDLRSNVFPDTNLLLRETDVLISDYSSIWIDFLPLNRPILGFLWDEEKYGSNRGLMYDYRTIFPGPISYTESDILNQLSKVLEKGELHNSCKQKALLKHFFHHTDISNCSRVYDEAQALLG